MNKIDIQIFTNCQESSFANLIRSVQREQFSCTVNRLESINVDKLMELKSAGALVVLELCSQWESELQGITISTGMVDIIYAASNLPGLARYAVKLSVSDFMTQPITATEVETVLVDIHSQKQLQDLSGSQSKNSGKSSVIMGCKGGCGASFLAYNVAQLIAEKSKMPTTLLDLDLQYSNAHTFLNSMPEHSLTDALNAAQHLDDTGVRGFFHKLGSGLNLMSAPHNELTLMEDVQGQQMGMLLDKVQSVSKHLIVDLPDYLNLTTLTALQKADEIYLVLQQDIAHIANAIKIIKILRDELFIDASRLVIVVNRYDKKNELKEMDIKNALHIDKILMVPNAHKVATLCNNEMLPVHSVAPKSDLGKSLLALSEAITGQDLSDQNRLFKRISRAFKSEPNYEYSTN